MVLPCHYRIRGYIIVCGSNGKYLNAFLHGDQVAALFVMLVAYLAFLVMEQITQNVLFLW